MDSDDDADLARAIALSMQEAAASAKSTKYKPAPAPKTATARKEREKEREVFVISSDEEEVVEVSPVAAKAKSTAKAQAGGSSKAVEAVKDAEPKAGAGPLSFLGDRAQMERERVARQKRLRPPSPPPAPPGSSGGDDDDSEDDDDGASGSEGSARKRARLGDAPSTTDAKTADGRRLFPDGAILRVDTKYAENAQTGGAESIRLSDLLGPREALALAVLSAFVIDPTWLYGFFNPATPVVLVTDAAMCGGDPDAEEPTLKNVFPAWVRVCPPMPSSGGGYRGCMHIKLMLLFNKQENGGGMRVVVGSANLVPHDWRDVENYLFVQDLPRASPLAPTPSSSSTFPPASSAFPPMTAQQEAEIKAMKRREKPGEAFAAVLARALRAAGVEEALGIMRRQGHTALPLPTLLPTSTSTSSSSKEKKTALEAGWDWARVRAALVPSVPGRWEGWAAVCGTGQPRLMRAVQALGCGLEGPPGNVKGKSAQSKPTWTVVAKGKGKGKAGKGKEGEGEWVLELDCLTSSIGTYTPPWLAAFRLCAGGRARALETWLDRGRRKTPSASGPTRILFPTLDTVRGTHMGEAGAGTVFCRRAQWEKIRVLVGDPEKGVEMRDARARSAPGVGMHTKMILGTLRAPAHEEPESETESDDSDIEVVEVKEPAQGKPHAWLYVGSHNFTASAWGTLSGSGFNPVLNVTNFELGVVLRLETSADAEKAVAWERPARRYARGDVPWIQEESPFFR
ncbi:hypothetical protein FB451DRAFT_1360519 [Mycena latifolia]|nr:hypothetical protein FB451DRAFT_1360519 [Mycena latifolia]